MKKTLLLLTGCLCSVLSLAQTVQVLDKVTRQALSGCAIYSHQPRTSAITDARGQADILAFAGSDSIFFHFVNYQPAVYSFRQLEAMNFAVALSEDNVSLNEIVVSANRWEQTQMEIPQRIEKISGKEIAFQNPQTAADLLGATGFAYIQKSQQAGGSPMLRGFATNRVLIVVDGVRMNNAIFRAGNLQNVISLDAGAMESAEILFGPGAVMYGSDAIGGVMDFHTLPARLSGGRSTQLTGSAFTRYSSANGEKTGHLDWNIGLKKWAFASSITYADYGDLRAGSQGNPYYLRPDYPAVINGVDSFRVNASPRIQVPSGYSQLNLMQKIRFQPSAYWDIDYAFHYSTTSDAPRYDRLYLKNAAGRFTNAEWYYGPQQWMMNRLAVQYTKPAPLYDQIRLVAARQDYRESRHDRRTGDARLRSQIETVNAYSLNLDIDKRLGERVHVFYGGEFVHNTVGSRAFRENIRTGEIQPTATRYPDGSTWQSYAVYTNLKYALHPQWILNGGLRYSYYAIRADFSKSGFDFPFTETRNRNGALNGSAGLVFKASEKWQLYASGSTGFRAPNIDDIGKVFDSEPGAVVVPNPGLRPEYAYNAEIGTARLLGKWLKVDLSAYYTLLDNALARRDYTFNGRDSIDYDGLLSRVQAIQNISRAYVYGIQAGIDLQLTPELKVTSTLSYQHGREQSEADLEYYPLRHAPPTFGSTHLTYERKKWRISAYAVYNARMTYENLALSERNDSAPYAKDASGFPYVPAWYTLNLKAAWFFHPNLSLNAGIENLTDQLYRPYASAISAPGRNFILALRGRL